MPRLARALARCGALAALACGAPADPVATLLIIAPVGDAPGWRLLQQHATDEPPTRAPRRTPTRGLLLTASGAGLRHEAWVADPRRALSCGGHGHRGAAVSVVVPRWANRLDVAGEAELVVRPPPPPPTSRYLSRRPPHRRRAAPLRSRTASGADAADDPPWAAGAQQLDDGIVTAEVYRAGYAERHLALVFLSGGYLAADKSKFWGDVDRAVVALRGREPFTRYLSMYNVFAIFQASAERGASKPHLGRSVRNNLGCSYGEEQVRRLSCDVELVLALARTGEASDIAVTLVNDDEYGGTGSTIGVATVYNGNQMGVVVAHELGHTMGLADEYDYGFTESSVIKLPNCWSGAGQSPWAEWAELDEDIKRAAPGAQSCSYHNYRRPTEDGCIMKTNLAGRFCAVCAEHVALATYSKDGMDATYPRCPVEHETVYLLPNESVTLYGNRALAGQADVALTWQVDGGMPFADGTRGSCFDLADASESACYVFDARQHEPGGHTVTLTVRDDSRWVLPSRRVEAMRHSSQFRIRIGAAPPAEGVEERVCGRTGARPYLSACDEGGDCSMRMVAHPFEPVQQPGKALGDWLIGIGVTGVAIGGLTIGIAWLLWKIAVDWLENVEGVHIEPLTRCQNAALRYLLGLSIVWALLSMALAGYIVWINEDAEAALPDDVFIPIMVSLAVFWLLQLIVNSLSATKSRPMLVAVLVIELVLLLGAAAALGLAASVVHDAGDSDSARSRLRGAWEYIVDHNPSFACTAQRNLECSGWDRACDSIPGRNSQCPTGCDRSNQFTEPCYNRVYEWLQSNFVTYTAALSAALLAWIVAVGCLFLLLCTIRPIERGSPRPLGRVASVRRAQQKQKEQKEQEQQQQQRQLGKSAEQAAPARPSLGTPPPEPLPSFQPLKPPQPAPDPQPPEQGQPRRRSSAHLSNISLHSRSPGGSGELAPAAPAELPQRGPPARASPLQPERWAERRNSGSDAVEMAQGKSRETPQGPRAECILVRKDSVSEPLGFVFRDAEAGDFAVEEVREGAAAWRSGCGALLGYTVTHVGGEPLRDIAHLRATARDTLQVALRFSPTAASAGPSPPMSPISPPPERGPGES